MLHIKSNKFVIFDHSLSLQYDFQPSVKFCLKEITPNLTISKVRSLSIVGYWFYNGRKLENPIKKRIDQSEEILNFSNFINTLSEIENIKLAEGIKFDFDKITNSKEILENVNSESPEREKEKENFINLLNALNLYLFKHQDCKVAEEIFFDNNTTKQKINFFFNNLEQELMEGDF